MNLNGILYNANIKEHFWLCSVKHLIPNSFRGVVLLFFFIWVRNPWTSNLTSGYLMVEECSCDKQLLLNNQVFSRQSRPQSEKMEHNDMVEQKLSAIKPRWTCNSLFHRFSERIKCFWQWAELIIVLKVQASHGFHENPSDRRWAGDQNLHSVQEVCSFRAKELQK